MSGIGTGSVEILVHTSAPSRGQDDSRYRTLARAYLDFLPASRATLSDLSSIDARNKAINSEAEGEPESQASYHPDEEPDAILSTGASSQSGLLDDISQSQDLDFTDISFNSVLDNADFPVFRERLLLRPPSSMGATAQTETQTSAESWQQPPSTVADSEPDNNVISEAHASPTEVLGLFLRHAEDSRLRPPTVLQPDLGRIASSDKSAQLSVELEVTTPSGSSSYIALPDSQKSTDIIPTMPQSRDLKREDGPHNQGTTKRKHSAMNSSQNDASSCVPEQSILDTQDRSRKRKGKLKTSDKTRTCLEESQGRAASSSSPAVTQSSSISNSTRISYASMTEIRAPPPATSISKFRLEMLHALSLDQLAEKMPLQILYKPQSQARELRAMERGYWFVNCMTWDEELRKRTWDCVGNFVGKGQAGWSVWCIREEDFRSLRIYCWGAFVGQIYLLLYMASENKIKGMGACWIGADGKEVIVMPS